MNYLAEIEVANAQAEAAGSAAVRELAQLLDGGESLWDAVNVVSRSNVTGLIELETALEFGAWDQRRPAFSNEPF